MRFAPVNALECGDVVELLFGGAGLTAAGEPAEAGPTGPHGPRRCRDRESAATSPMSASASTPRRPAACSTARRGRVRWNVAPAALCSLDQFGCDPHVPPFLRRQRKNAAATPPSTGTIKPVVRDSRPSTRASTASATCSGSTSRPRKRAPRVVVAELVGSDAVRRGALGLAPPPSRRSRIPAPRRPGSRR